MFRYKFEVSNNVNWCVQDFEVAITIFRLVVLRRVVFVVVVAVDMV